MEQDKQQVDPVAIEYFKALRAEIDLRIRNQSHYTISKIVACGALLGHLVKDGPTPALLSIPLVAVLLDFIIYNNLAHINELGQYIKNELEAKAFSSNGETRWVLYETRSGQTRTAGIRDLLDRFGQVGISIAFLVIPVLFYSAKGNLADLPFWPTLGVLTFFLVDIILGVYIKAAE